MEKRREPSARPLACARASSGAVASRQQGAVRGACKPGSVQPLRAWATIPLEPMSPSASRGQPGGRGGNPLPLKPEPGRQPSLFGLAPGGVCRAAAIAGGAVGSYPTVSPLPEARMRRGRSVLCGTFPGLASAGRWPAPSSRGARTFLQRGIAPAPAVARPPGTDALLRPRGAPGQASMRASSPAMRARVSASATPSTRAGRQWRWKAVTSTGRGRSVR